ncbi:pilus assembly protein PilM, partial [bacterium]|nr:pilus assembly protein PilM [bacterium]
PVKDLYTDFKRVKMSNEKGKDNIIVVAARKKIIHSYMEALKKADLEVIALDVEPAAVARALIAAEETDKTAYLILDMGAETTTITIYDFGSIQITGSTRIAGNTLTESFVKALKISVSDAEDVKRHIINAERKIKKPLFDSAIKPVLTKLAKEIERSIGYYTNYMNSPHEIKKIIVTGGNAHFPGMTEFLADYFRIKTEIGNPWTNVTAYPLKAMPKLKASLYTTAIGLALRELVEK